MTNQPGIHGPMAKLYDVFVDWPARLSREMPGIIASLQSVNARKILDVGCGTGRHVKALCDAGFDAYGADISPPCSMKHANSPAMIHDSFNGQWAHPRKRCNTSRRLMRSSAWATSGLR
ncbi:MAG: methyltransferase domain-containing protein [Phycisphaerales bacterium]